VDARQIACAQTFRALADYNPPGTDWIDRETICRDNVATGPDTPGGPNVMQLDPSTCMNLGCQPSCVDPDNNECVLPNGSLDWEAVTIYSPRYDIRQCPTSLPSPFDTTATYEYVPDWSVGPNGSIILPPSADPSVLRQNQTGLVPTNTWAACVNYGYDPPLWSFSQRDYSGGQAGSRTDTTKCAPVITLKDPPRPGHKQMPNGCNAAISPDEVEFFPGGRIEP
jgi:hypothetical protein